MISKENKKKLIELKEYVALATINSKYNNANIELIKYMTGEVKSPGVYVTLNKPFKTIESDLKNSKVDTRIIIFIDAVTKTVGGEIKKIDQCLFIGSPENLSDISIAMDQAITSLKGKDKFLFFDSLNTLLLYNTAETVARFIHFLAGKMRIWKVKGIIISLEKKANKELIDELSQFCDIKFEM
nr:hypothetical protein [Candidatus Woesearchaeota archaeon]